MISRSPAHVGDMAAEGMVHVVAARSPIARGRIVSVAARELPPGYGLILPSDIPGNRAIEASGALIPVLADEKVSYPGEPIALLYGPDRAELESLLSEIEIASEEEWPLFSYESFSSDQILRKALIERGDAESALEGCAHRIERTYRTGSQAHFYPEPQGAFAAFAYDKMEIVSSTQWPFHVRDSVAAVLGTAPGDVLVRPASAQMHLDGKLWHPSVLAAQAALACLISKRPARLLVSREEDFRFSPKRSRSAISLRIGLDDTGRIKGLAAQVIFDSGAYGPFAREALDRACAALSEAYRIDQLRIEGYAVRTNSLPMGPFAGMGLSQAYFALESIISEASQELETDPIAIRELNAARRPPASRKARAAEGSESVWERLVRESDFARKHSSYEVLRKRGIDRKESIRRGIGYARANEGGAGAAASGHWPAAVECSLGKDLVLTIRACAAASDSGAAEIWKTIASGILGIGADSVEVIAGPTDSVPDCGPSTLSRNVTITGALVAKCAHSIQKRRFREGLPISARKAYRPAARAGDSIDARFAAAGSAGAAIVEVEFDPGDMVPSVAGIWIGIDAGRIASPSAAALAVKRAALGALSWSTGEALDFSDGLIPEHIFWRYSLPRAEDSPRVSIFFEEADPKAGYSGLGDLAYHVVPAAFARALSQATGLEADSIPAGLDRIAQEILGP